MKPVESFAIFKYVMPIWYFNLFPENVNSFSTCYFNSSLMKVSDEFKNLVCEDSRYSTQTAKDLDIGFQLWNKGVMLEVDNIPLDKLIHKENLTLEDNYIFIRKYFRKHRVYYFLVKNILSFKNFITEISAFSKTKGVNKVDLIKLHAEYIEYKNFSSSLLNEKPFISIIIPTLNRYVYLKNVLQDLSKQDYKNFETIVVDQSDKLDKDF